jgi:CubicO group peptidase (beta-lactamase class C family)
VATKVTIHQLLTHTGGTGDIFGPDFDAHRTELRTLADYVTLYGERGVEFEPGSDWAYSNYGFTLLGVVIEKVTGQSYYDYVQQHVYAPAGMTRSGSLPEDHAPSDLSIGYTKPPGNERVGAQHRNAALPRNLRRRRLLDRRGPRTVRPRAAQAQTAQPQCHEAADHPEKSMPRSGPAADTRTALKTLATRTATAGSATAAAHRA